MASSDLSQQPGVDRFERFDSLQAGQYWRAKEAVPEKGIEAGEVLLIQSVRQVDGAPHTLHLRPHPSKKIRGRDAFYIRFEEDDGAGTQWITEHRLLVDHFLSCFEHEPDAERVREAEIAGVQGEIDTLQRELVEVQSDPQKLAHRAEEAFGDEIEQVENPGLPVAPGQIGQAGMGDVLHPELSGSHVDTMKSLARREHRLATLKSKWIQQQTESISDRIQALTPYYEEKAAAALSQTEDVRDYVSRLQAGIESLDLFVGRDVEVTTICEGDFAPTDEPLTVYQRKLMIDEELALWQDVGERFDSMSADRFFSELAENPDLRDQIMPHPRAVVCMATTRRNIKYSNVWEAMQKEGLNRQVFLLMRDGENVYRVHSPVESHLESARLFPSREEVDALYKERFLGVDLRDITFRDVAYCDSLKKHELLTLHYKRFLILLAGLQHREGLFAPFYGDADETGFVSMEFQQQHMRFIHDDEKDGAIEDSRYPSLHEWIGEQNRGIQSGSRVLCYFPSLMSPETAPAAFVHAAWMSRGYEQRYSPEEDSALCVASREKNSLYVKVPVSGCSFENGGRSFNCKVYLDSRATSEHGSEPFLCIDDVSLDEVDHYLYSRRFRQDHVFYIRLFKRVRARILADLEEEAPARAQMHEALSYIGVSGQRAQEVIDETIRRSRQKHRGEWIFAAGECSSDKWKRLLDQMYRLARQDELLDQINAWLSRHEDIVPLRASVDGSGQVLLYAAPPEAEQDNRLCPHAWVKRMVLSSGKQGLRKLRESDTVLMSVQASETVIQQWDEAQFWCDRDDPFGSPKKKVKALDAVASKEDIKERWCRGMDSETLHDLADLYTKARRALSKGGVVNEPCLIEVLGMRKRPGKNPMYVVLRSTSPLAALAEYAEDDDFDMLREKFADIYMYKHEARKRFTGQFRAGGHWSLGLVPVEELDLDAGVLQDCTCFSCEMPGVKDETANTFFREGMASLFDAVAQEQDPEQALAEALLGPASGPITDPCLIVQAVFRDHSSDKRYECKVALLIRADMEEDKDINAVTKKVVRKFGFDPDKNGVGFSFRSGGVVRNREYARKMALQEFVEDTGVSQVVDQAVHIDTEGLLGCWGVVCDPAPTAAVIRSSTPAGAD